MYLSSRSGGMLVTTTAHVDIKFAEVDNAFTKLFLPSWTWCDFAAAITDPDFAAAMWPGVSQLEPEPPDDARAFLKRKFEICGGSARLMFGHSVERVCCVGQAS
eukprot:TRINITY_DN5757_c0_g2_i13.p1 TRINITY_DN5757_c0_g2~~TRINITY_DN5757_c0_g2_i13.p1  ORF type:complete len:104 (-),score=5.98 TRINITY_DN5757_c0_g2_i13:137-448(-)